MTPTPAFELTRAIARELWSTSRRPFLWLIVAWLALALGQPVLAISLRGLTRAALGAEQASAVGYAAGAALALAVLAQALYQSYLLRIELLDKVGLQLSTRLLRAVANRPTIDHLENPTTLDRIRVGLDGWAVVSAFTGGSQLLAVILGLLLTFPLLGAASGASLLILPLCLPLVIAAARAFRFAVAGGEEAADSERAAENLLLTAFDPAAACELRITGAGPALLEEYRRQHSRAAQVRIRAQLKGAAWLAVAWVIFIAGFTVILFFAVDGATTGAADVIPIIAIALQLQGIAVVMVNGSAEVVRGRQVSRAHRTVLGELAAPEGARSDGGVPIRMREGISLRGVSFNYPRSDREVLRDITLDIPAGSMVALVGSHGSGKTTLVKLLTRMYEPTAGSIEVDGEPLAGMPVAAWRARTAACFQDFIRLPTAVREAVGVGDLAALRDDDRIRGALERAGATSVVDRLPEGLETLLGEPGLGTELSGGQWQRLALARSFMRQDSLLVVLDEPTASFDPLAEREMFDRNAEFAHALGREYGTVTLAITHRFSTVQTADLIVVLQDGELREHGSHDELLRRNGVYAAMYAQQREAYL